MRPALTAPVFGSSATILKRPVLPLKVTPLSVEPVTSVRSRYSFITPCRDDGPVTVTVVLTSLRLVEMLLDAVLTVYGKRVSTSEPENT